MKQQGFTLIELLVTIAIVGILATIGIPAFKDMVDRTRVTTATNSFITEIQYTRSEAIKRGVSVTICTSTTYTGCSGSDNWANGWIVKVDGTNEILRVHQSPHQAFTILGSSDHATYAAFGNLI